MPAVATPGVVLLPWLVVPAAGLLPLDVPFVGLGRSWWWWGWLWGRVGRGGLAGRGVAVVADELSAEFVEGVRVVEHFADLGRCGAVVVDCAVELEAKLVGGLGGARAFRDDGGSQLHNFSDALEVEVVLEALGVFGGIAVEGVEASVAIPG